MINNSINKKMYLNNGVSITQTGEQTTSPLFSTDYIQGIMKTVLGHYIVCEFLIGTQLLETRKGYLVASGINFFTLYDVEQNVYTVCDMYSLKFVNITEYKNMEYVTNYQEEYHLNEK